MEIATLGGGCFWCLEAVFDELQGVDAVVSGYMGGALENPNYRQVCGGDTGHAEVVQVTFNPDAISYREVLDVFFVIHDPTTLNRQGRDVGTQYRSVIFWHSEDQQRIAETTIAELDRSGAYGAALVTELAPATTFYPAENEHQDYYVNNEYQPYCQFVVSPKLSKFREKFAHKRKQTP